MLLQEDLARPETKNAGTALTVNIGGAGRHAVSEVVVIGGRTRQEIKTMLPLGHFNGQATTRSCDFHGQRLAGQSWTAATVLRGTGEFTSQRFSATGLYGHAEHE